MMGRFNIGFLNSITLIFEMTTGRDMLYTKDFSASPFYQNMSVVEISRNSKCLRKELALIRAENGIHIARPPIHLNAFR